MLTGRFRLAAWVACVFLVALFCAFFFDLWLKEVEIFSVNMPKIDVSNDYVTALFWAFGLGLSIFFWPVQKMERMVLLLLWCARCFTTLFFMLSYEKFYVGLDSWGYLRAALGTDPFNTKTTGGTGNLNALIKAMNEYLPVFSSYHSLKVLFSMMGFIGVFVLYRAIALATGKKDLKVLLFLGLFPSILFWSSILGKDPLYFVGTCFFIYGTVAFYRNRPIQGICFFVSGLLMCCYVRLWAAPILVLPILAAEVLIRWRPSFKNLVKTVFAIVIGFYLLRSLSGYIDSLVTRLILENIVVLNRVAGLWGTGATRGGSGLEAVQFHSLGDVLLFVPFGAFTALFRPLLGEVNNMFGILAGLENIFLLGFLFFSLRKIDYKKLGTGLLMGCLLTVLVWASTYGFVSSQNLGSGFRFRLQIVGQLFLVIFMLKHSDRKQQ